MATQLCQKCKQAHPGRVCDYDEKSECAETIAVDEVAQPRNEPSKKRKIEVRYDLDQSASPVRRLDNLRVQKMEFAPPQGPYRLNSDRKESSSIWLPADSQCTNSLALMCGGF